MPPLAEREGVRSSSCQRFLLIRKESARRGGIRRGESGPIARTAGKDLMNPDSCGKLLSRALSGSGVRLERGETGVGMLANPFPQRLKTNEEGRENEGINSNRRQNEFF
ncbi:hypothetical protein CDAR_95411 [Caerostris darwini]|uniref:Uncharacterized protein n=1 Tax=Caerostris darwini TaxID=1538125 RepID=A0AAV4PJ64_9ARAC|nr:hypothetical protein CDAR_95411 [Caerostris darwini]